MPVTQTAKPRVLARQLAALLTDQELEAVRGGQTIGCSDAGQVITRTALSRQQEGCDPPH